MVSNDTLTALQLNAETFFASCKKSLSTNLASVFKKVDEVKGLSDNESALVRQINLQENTIDTVVNNQKRLRENLEKLTEHHGESQLVRRYLADMNRDEDTLLEARQKALNLTDEKENIQKKLKVLIQTIKKEALALIEDCSEVDC